jgi:uncharacterized protein YceK
MKVFIVALLAVAVLSGCADKMTLKCRDCTINNEKYACTGCKLEATASKFNGSILEVLPPIVKPK